MCDTGGRFRRIARIVAVLVCIQVSVTVAAETADERIQRLENEVEELRQMLNEQKQPQPAPTTPVNIAPTPNVEAAPVRSGALLRYYISNRDLGKQPPVDTAPIVQGRFSNTDNLSFDPKSYDVPDSGLFSNYRDPSSYPYVGLLVEGDLAIQDEGEYELIVSPKPIREGGTNVKTRMSAWLQIDGRTVVQFHDQSSWESQRGRVHLGPGLHRLRMWAVAASDGFGPSPTESRLLLALKAPGDVSPRPLRDLHTIEK
jgi:hypothetical protein